jgi:hypothetical protein
MYKVTEKAILKNGEKEMFETKEIKDNALITKMKELRSKICQMFKLQQ